MPRMALLVFPGRVFRDAMPGLPRLGSDDPGQGAAAERRVDLHPQLVEDVVRVALEEVLFRLDADLLEFGGGRLADVRQVGQLFGDLAGHGHGGSP